MLPVPRFLSLLGGLLLAGCGGGIVFGSFDCDAEIAELTRTLGPADAREARIENGIQVESFWFNQRGLVVTFSWSTGLPCQRRDVQVPR